MLRLSLTHNARAETLAFMRVKSFVCIAFYALTRVRVVCGIGGLLQRQPSRALGRAYVDGALRHLAKRGPDANGVWSRDGVEFVHTRLSIIDVEGGAQPIEDEHGVLVFNGEIYNYADLRDPAVAYRTRSDTEVLLKGLNREGVAFLDRLDGMYAFAYLDKRARRVVLGRDPFGIKPLYYVRRDGLVAFASTMHPLMMFSRKDINRQAFVQYYMVRGALSPNTLFDDVHELPAGSCAVIDLDDLSFHTARWFSDDTPPINRASEAELLENLDQTLDLAVRRHLVSDVPVATLLSGGVDSGLVTAIAARHNPQLAAFSIGFRNESFDESPYAQAIARRYGLKHHVKFCDAADFQRLIETWPSLIDDPVADPSAVLVHHLAAFARECGYKVVLSGEGSDELFGGYNQHRRFHLALRLHGFGRFAPWAADFAHKAAPHRTRLVHHLNVVTRTAAFHGTGMIFEPHLAPEIFADPIPPFPAAQTLQDALALDRRQRLADDILGLSDRATMQASVELRVPFVTRYMAAFAAALPDGMLVRGGRRKYLLHKLAERYLPSACIRRPKVGFDLPLAEWFRGPLRELVHDTLASTWQRDFFRPGAMERIVGWHMAGRADFSDKIWAFVLLDQNVRAMRGLGASLETREGASSKAETMRCA